MYKKKRAYLSLLLVFLSCLAFGFNNCYKDKLDKIESQTSSSTMTQARPSPNTTSTPTQRSTPTINPSPNPDINQSLLEAVDKEGNIIKLFVEALNNGADVNHIDNHGASVFSYATASASIARSRVLHTIQNTIHEWNEKKVIDRDKSNEKLTSYMLMGMGL